MDLVNLPKEVTSKSMALATTDNPLSSSKFIQELNPPKNPIEWVSKKSKNGNIIHTPKDLNGYIATEHGPVHPLKVIAGLCNSKLLDITTTKRPQITTKDAFQPFQVKESYTAISNGQHNRNSKEYVVLKMPSRIVAEIKPTAKLKKLSDDTYYDGKELVIRKEFSKKYMPVEFYNHINQFLNAKENLIRVGKEFYFLGDLTPISTEELIYLLRDEYQEYDFMKVKVYSDESGKETYVNRPQHFATKLGKWFRENVTEISKVEHYYSYLNEEVYAELKGRAYKVTGPLSKGYRPKVQKPEEQLYNDIITWFKRKRIPEIDEVIASSIASGFDVQWKGSKEYLNIINACSDFAKTQLFSIPMQECGLATSMKSTDLAGLAGVGQTRLSGSNPLEIAQYPINIFDEAATKDKKVDAAFIDLMKTFTDGMALRTLNSGNVNVRGHIAVIMSRVEVSELKNAHDEYLNRMNKLEIGENIPFEFSDAPASVEVCRNTLAHYYYETATKYIKQFDVMTAKERTEWCNKNISFSYASQRVEDKQTALMYPYQVVLSLVRAGASQMIDAGLNSDTEDKFRIGDMADTTHRYDKNEAVIGSRDGRVMIVSKSKLYTFLQNGEGLKQGTKDDIEKIINKLFSSSSGKSPQISYQQLFTHKQDNAWKGLQLDIDELFSDNKSKIDEMDYNTICTNLMSHKPNSKQWAQVAKRVIVLDSKLADEETEELEEEGENPWMD